MAAEKPSTGRELLSGSIEESRQMGRCVFQGVGGSTEPVLPKGRPCCCQAVHPALAPGCHQKQGYGTRWHKRCRQVVVTGVGGGQ